VVHHAERMTWPWDDDGDGNEDIIIHHSVVLNVEVSSKLE